MSAKLEDILLIHAARTLRHPQPFVKLSDGSSLKLEDDVVQVFRGVLAKRASGSTPCATGWRSIQLVLESDYLGYSAAFSHSDLHGLDPRYAVAFLTMFLTFAGFRAHVSVMRVATEMLQKILEKTHGEGVVVQWPDQG